MIKLFGLIDRREDFSVADFSLYWRTVHVHEALKLKPFIARYVQNHFWPTPLAGLKRPADGSPELWFDTPEKTAAMTASEAYLTGAYVDEPRFMSGRASGVAMVETLIAPPTERAAIKAIFLYAPAADVSLSRFAALQSEHSAPLFLSARRAIGRVSSATIPGPSPALYAGADELWWATQAEFEQDWDERGAIPAFVDHAASAGCLADEAPIF